MKSTTRARPTCSSETSTRTGAPRAFGRCARHTFALLALLALASVACAGDERGLEAVYAAPDVASPIAPIDRAPLRALPVFGGHGLVVGDTLWVADPERDVVYVHANEGATIDRIATIALPRGSTPFRLAHADGIVYASLRGSGSLARLDASEHTFLGVHEVCADPRGVAADVERVLVACAGGELVETDPNGTITRRVMLEPDLRDVVIDERGVVYVSVFLAARVLELDDALSVARRLAVPDEVPPPVIDDEALEPPGFTRPTLPRFANTAWRMRAAPGGGVDVLHQLSATTALATPSDDPRVDPGDYGSATGGGELGGRAIVAGALTMIDARGAMRTLHLVGAGFFVDFARTPRGIAFGAGGEGEGSGGLVLTSSRAPGFELPQLHAAIRRAVPSVEAFADTAVGLARTSARVVGFHASPVAEPPTVFDTGHEIFHRTTEVAMACASCHAEGRDDGLVWDFGRGPRRTQPLTGGLLSTGAFHWKGDVRDLQEIMTRTFEEQMRGEPLERIEVEALATWLDGLEAVGATAADDAVARGAEHFVTAGCDSCHSGPAGTNGLSAVLDDGERWQVPMLSGVGLRAPYFHDGCAPNLRAALDGCDGRLPHPGAETLSESERDDLAAFVSTWD